MSLDTWTITGFEGINNQNDPSKLKQPQQGENGGSGPVELAECVNFDIDDDGALSSREESPAVFSKAYDAKLTKLYAGMTLTAQGNLLRFTKPWSSEYDERRSAIQYYAPIVLIQELNNGVWISTTETISFHAGRNPTTLGGFDKDDAYDFPAIMGTGESVPASKIGMEGEGFVAVFATTKGICFGTESGTLINVSEGKFSYAPGQRGVSHISEKNGLVQYQVKMINEGDSYNENTAQDGIYVESL